MAYSITTLRAALKELGGPGFVWEADKTAVNPHLTSQFPYGRQKGNVLNDMTEYCWLAYSKAFNTSGPQVIGRKGDLWVAEHLERVGITNKDKETLWDPYTKGNIQVLDKWAPVVNDCWVLGGVHRRADFDLVSVRTLENLWSFKDGFHVVTAREIFGVLNFGYTLKQGSTPVKLVSTDAGKAQTATLQQYAALMKNKEALGADSVRSILQMDPALKKEIEGFDKSRLHHVIPRRLSDSKPRH
jgi:hypothetical protein